MKMGYSSLHLRIPPGSSSNSRWIGFDLTTIFAMRQAGTPAKKAHKARIRGRFSRARPIASCAFRATVLLSLDIHIIAPKRLQWAITKNGGFDHQLRPAGFRFDPAHRLRMCARGLRDGRVSGGGIVEARSERHA